MKRWRKYQSKDSYRIMEPEHYELTESGKVLAHTQRNPGEAAWFWYGCGMSSLWAECPKELHEKDMPPGYYSSLVNAQQAVKKWLKMNT